MNTSRFVLGSALVALFAAVGLGTTDASAQNFPGAPCARPVAQVQPTYAQPTYAQPTYAQPTYAQPTYAQPVAYARPRFARPVFVRPAPQPVAYPQPVFVRPAPQPVAYPQPVVFQGRFGRGREARMEARQDRRASMDRGRFDRALPGPGWRHGR